MTDAPKELRMFTVKIERTQMVEWSGLAVDRDSAIAEAMEQARRGTQKAKQEGSSWDLLGIKLVQAIERVAPKNLRNGGAG